MKKTLISRINGMDVPFPSIAARRMTVLLNNQKRFERVAFVRFEGETFIGYFDSVLHRYVIESREFIEAWFEQEVLNDAKSD